MFGVKQFMKGVHEISGKPAVQSQKVGETFTSKEHGYSLRVPQGWEHKPPPPSTADMMASPKESGITSNMVTTIEPFPGSLSEYVDVTRASLERSTPSATVVSESEFLPTRGSAGHKMKLHNKYQDIDLAQTLYFFSGAGDNKIIVNCTTPAKFEAQLEPLFDDCLRTFAVTTQ